MASAAKTTQIVELVSKETGMSSKDAKAAVKATFAAVGKLLKKNDRVVVTGVGSFSKKIRPADKGGKKATNPFTGASYITKPKPAKTSVKFRAGKDFL